MWASKMPKESEKREEGKILYKSGRRNVKEGNKRKELYIKAASAAAAAAALTKREEIRAVDKGSLNDASRRYTIAL